MTSMQMITNIIISFNSWLSFKSVSFASISARSFVICSLSTSSMIVVVLTKLDMSVDLLSTASSIFDGFCSVLSEVVSELSSFTYSCLLSSFALFVGVCASSWFYLSEKSILLSRSILPPLPGIVIIFLVSIGFPVFEPEVSSLLVSLSFWSSF